jgi:hypothetical protein
MDRAIAADSDHDFGAARLSFGGQADGILRRFAQVHFGIREGRSDR